MKKQCDAESDAPYPTRPLPTDPRIAYDDLIPYYRFEAPPPIRSVLKLAPDILWHSTARKPCLWHRFWIWLFFGWRWRDYEGDS